MRLSEMSTEELARALCRLTPPLCRIATDERVTRALREAGQASEAHEPVLAAGGRLMQALVPVLLADHAEDLWEALAVLTGQAPEAIRRQTGLETIRMMRACWDEELARFFTYAGTATKESCCGR